ncbi:hypothetical protein B566_EDAN009677 [Ephemera danica]|nr:hypothetical protein B566_EDAN009677 [Ephemera danica]
MNCENKSPLPILRSPSHESINTNLSLFSVSSIELKQARIARGPSPNPDPRVQIQEPEKTSFFEEDIDLLKTCAQLSAALDQIEQLVSSQQPQSSTSCAGNHLKVPGNEVRRKSKNLPLTIRDVEKEKGKPLSKYERNIMIFNWLHTLEDTELESLQGNLVSVWGSFQHCSTVGEIPVVLHLVLLEELSCCPLCGASLELQVREVALLVCTLKQN